MATTTATTSPGPAQTAPVEYPAAVSRAVARLAARYPARRVLITGATSGSGEALAVLFGSHGWRVAVTGRSAEKVEQSARKVRAAGGEVVEQVIEVTDYDDFERAAQEISVQWGGLDVLVNNAGIGAGGSLEETSLESWRRTFDVNTFSVVYGCRAFVPVMRASGGGHIVNVASSAGILCAPEMSHYNASKAAVIAISESLAVELAPAGIDVTVACPGAFKSGILDAGKAERSGGKDRMLKTLEDVIDRTARTADDVAGDVVKDVARRRIYSVPDREIHAQWIIKRVAPELSRRLITFMFTRRLWVFAGIGD